MPVYNSYKRDLLNGAAPDLDTHTIKLALATASYTPNIDSHDNFDDITNEVTGTGYTAGGATLANPAVTADNTDDEGVFDADDVTWATATITARYGILYRDTGTPSTSRLIGYVDFGSDKISTGGNFVVQWNSEGVVNIN